MQVCGGLESGKSGESGRQIAIRRRALQIRTNHFPVSHQATTIPLLMSPARLQGQETARMTDEEYGLGGKRNMLSLPCPRIAGAPGAWPCWLGLISRHLCFLLVPPRLAALAEPYAGPTTPVFLGQHPQRKICKIHYPPCQCSVDEGRDQREPGGASPASKGGPVKHLVPHQHDMTPSLGAGPATRQTVVVSPSSCPWGIRPHAVDGRDALEVCPQIKAVAGSWTDTSSSSSKASGA